jgi:hypothetical protein
VYILGNTPKKNICRRHLGGKYDKGEKKKQENVMEKGEKTQKTTGKLKLKG